MGIFFQELGESDIKVSKVIIGVWVAILAADIVWAVLKIRKSKAKSEVNTQ